ncbi:unnamed protein product [Didymodactylos carnosus]|uniref:G-protein coupled receptors family 1 profile domain-containing protein n=1 Tax=Didymodactylos carnosus TaxID=1234261 RepID=A0A8S2H8I9_9BILA|nr:unnamed protein product [Didymodactylos carnosus]CAF3591147.1 unnamed protein product [Didymodactylos carnosus]
MLINNVGLLIYFALVSVLGTIGNGIILFAYFNRCGSSTSTTFIVILACVDLWTCSVVIPCIGFMEYNEFDVNTPLCRFYSFSKIIIIVSSFIMSAIAFDRFFSIALPHLRIMTPRLVKILLTILILIAIFLGILAALAFSSQPWLLTYATNYTITLSNNHIVTQSTNVDSSTPLHSEDIATLRLSLLQTYLSNSSIKHLNITNFSFELINTRVRCFADTTIISDGFRQILKHVSNKIFYLCIVIVTVLYTITYILALRRQAPRLRALKKSINVLDRYDRYDSVSQMNSFTDAATIPTGSTSCCAQLFYSPHRLTIPADSLKAHRHRPELSSFNEYELHSNVTEVNNAGKKIEESISSSSGEEVTASHQQQKTVSFNIERQNLSNNEKCVSLPSLHLDKNNNPTQYKFNCFGKHRQILVTIRLQRPKFPFAFIRREQQIQSVIPSCSDEMKETNSHASLNNSNSDTLKRQLKQHRIKQIRMASTFLMITMSFIAFYLPSILNAERIIKSPLWIYYLYLSTHALNPIIYCFMNGSLRMYVLSMLRCVKLSEISSFERSVNTR